MSYGGEKQTFEVMNMLRLQEIKLGKKDGEHTDFLN